MVCDKLSAIDPADAGSKFLQPQIDFLVTAINLFNVVDDAGAFGRQCRDQQGDTGADIR